MKRFLLKIIFLLTIKTATCTAITTSIIIPCAPCHAKYLYELLNLYEIQTIPPDEIVISLSESEKINPDLIQKIQSKSWLFPVNLLLSPNKMYAGQNRNNACLNAQGDILICQDADDIPHPQRTEVIKYLFEKYQLDHLAHGYNLNNDSLSCLYENIEKIPFRLTNQKFNIINHPIQNGNIAISRSVFNKIKWSNKQRKEDIEFNQKVYKNFKNLLVVEAPLYLYRRYLSSLTQ